MILAIRTSIGFTDANAGIAAATPGRLIYSGEGEGEGLPKKRTSAPRHTKARAVRIPTGGDQREARSTRRRSPILVRGIAYASTRLAGYGVSKCVPICQHHKKRTTISTLCKRISGSTLIYHILIFI